MSSLFIILFLVIGFIAGIFAGLLGIGGGVVFIPSLLFLLPLIGVEPEFAAKSAIATSLFAGTFASSSSLFNHNKKKNIDLQKGVILAAGVIISAFLAPHLIVVLDAKILRNILGIFIFVVAVKLLIGEKQKELKVKEINKLWLFPLGLLFGGLAAISGLGGGVFYVPILLYFLNGDLKHSVGTSTLVVFSSMVSASISFAILNHEWNSEALQLGYLNVPAALLMGIGAIAGAYLGVKLIFKVPIPIFRKLFSLFLFFVSIKIIYG